jgi:hypothetical protein
MPTVTIYADAATQDGATPAWVNLPNLLGAPGGSGTVCTTTDSSAPATITVGFPATEVPGTLTSIDIGVTGVMGSGTSEISVLGFIGAFGAAFNGTIGLTAVSGIRENGATIIDAAAAKAGIIAGVTGLELSVANIVPVSNTTDLRGLFLRVTYSDGIIGGGGATGSAKALPLHIVKP